jgi:DNA-binding beta-propeller fold protein YncE
MDEKATHEKSPQPRRAFICNLMSEMVSVVDLETHGMVNIHVGTNPVFSMVSPHDPEKLIVSLHNYDRKNDEGLLALVDLKTNSVVQRIIHPGPAMPSGMVYDELQDILYVADENLHRIYAHDGGTLEVLSYLDAGRAPVHVDISNDRKHLVATNRMSADLNVYDLDQRSANADIGRVIRLGQAPSCHPYDVKFSQDSDICYVTDFGHGELLVVDIHGHLVTDRIRVGLSPFGMALCEDASTAYVCNMKSSSVSIVDLQKRAVVGEISNIDGYPSHCAIDGSRGQLLVTCQGGRSNGSVQAFDLETKEPSFTIVDDMIRSPIGISFDL